MREGGVEGVEISGCLCLASVGDNGVRDDYDGVLPSWARSEFGPVFVWAPFMPVLCDDVVRIGLHCELRLVSRETRGGVQVFCTWKTACLPSVGDNATTYTTHHH